MDKGVTPGSPRATVGKSEKLKQRMEDFAFRPLTSGLGFHPFSEGLPYANPDKKPKRNLSQGSGAVAAGAPQFVPPRNHYHGSRYQVENSHTLQEEYGKTVATSLVTPLPKKPATLEIQGNSFGLGYVYRRVLAYITDTMINLGFFGVTFSIAISELRLGSIVGNNPYTIVLLATFALAFNWTSITAQEITFKTSIGKRLFGMNLKGTSFGLFLRACFFLVSVGAAGLGVVSALFHREKRCWHDILLDVQPAEIARL